MNPDGMEIVAENIELHNALKICYHALRDLTSNDNVYDDVNDKSISFEQLRTLIWGE